ncbi:MAG: hypothetical protein Unbinned1322contig1000_13 [Prokaryotic dsDNA virus sp.]|nr:hypothetical protein [Aequorivita sp.]QDP57269.1 MAG: hypothetical protein Unbinned1322contig1000_13 [Prokaryotic dsDNA virus sp.]|tara:strand:+ start:4251 stop:4622 length:372 start_codon:yes stop_codon:yes gene_type:complete
MRYQISINKMVTEDSYDDGEIGMTSDYGEIVKLHVESLENLPLEVAQFLDCEVEDLYAFDNGSVEYTCLESDAGYAATENLKALWKEGKCKLYNASYQCFITEVWSNEVKHEQLLAVGLKGIK